MASNSQTLPHRQAATTVTADSITPGGPPPQLPGNNVNDLPVPLMVPHGGTDDSSAVSTANDVSTLGSASATQRSMRFNTASNLIHIKAAVSNVLFRNIKFISCKEDLRFSTDKTSIAQIILTTINVPPSTNLQATCWDQIRNRVPELLNRKRTITTNALKNRFEGKH